MTWVHWSDEELELVAQASDVYSVIVLEVTMRRLQQVDDTEGPVDTVVQKVKHHEWLGPFSREMAEIVSDRQKQLLQDERAETGTLVRGMRVYIWPQWMAAAFVARLKKGGL